MDLTLLAYSKHHFDAWLVDSVVGLRSRITAVYGHPDVSGRSSLWNLMKSLSMGTLTPWLCFGDFNEIISNS